MQRTRAVIEGPGVVLAPDGRIRFFNSHRRTRVERPSKWWLVRNYSCEPSTVSTLHSTSLFVRPGSCAGRRSLAGRGPHGRGVGVPCGNVKSEEG